MSDPINPSHYQGDYVMRIIEDFKLGFCLGNVVKYILRAENKGKLDDYLKAEWYLKRHIESLREKPIASPSRSSTGESMSEANDITARLLIEIPKRFPGARVWRNNRVDVMVAGRGGKPRRVMAGIDGQADITGIFPRHHRGVTGLRCEIEVKAGRDKQSPEQKAFEKMITDAGGIYIVARSVDQCLEELGRWA